MDSSSEVVSKLLPNFEASVRECLGGQITDDQRKVLYHFCNGERYVLLRACNGAGKTAVLAAIALTCLRFYSHISVIALSKNMTHLQRNFWKEIRRQSRRIQKWRDVKVQKYSYSPEPNRAIYAIAPNQIESAQGFHDAKIVVLVDEATGIPEQIFEALLANMSSDGSQMVCAYNPLSPDAFVYKAETEKHWKTVAMSALEHPNVIFDKEIIPGAVTRTWVEDHLRVHSKECDPRYPGALRIPWSDKYYERTAAIAIRVLGEYHLINHDGFIDAELIANRTRDIAGAWDAYRPVDTPLFVGIDISRGIKDRTIACILRHDGAVIGFEEFFQTNLAVLAQEIQKRFPRDLLAIDDTGLGSGVTDRLKQLGHPSIYPVHFNSTARNFYRGHINPSNSRTEMYLLIEKDLRSGFLTIPRDHQLARELTAWKINSVYGGRYCRVDYKTTIARRLQASPDKSDSLALAVYCRYIRKHEQVSYIL